jgi:hypothetical protein
VPGTPSTTASAINDTGAIVGNYFAGGRLHGFVLSGGNYTTLDVPGSTVTFAGGINNAGQIVGNYMDASGVSHGFLATPASAVTTFAWHGPTMTIATGVTGNPSFVQALPGTYGTKGNYELVVPLQSGGIGHFFRNNDDPTLPWNGPFTFATDQGIVDAVSLIQSNFSTQFVNTGTQGPGNLAVVERTGPQLNYFFRDDVTFTWSGPTGITSGVFGVPSFLQAKPGTYGTKGNYELVTPLSSGGMAHFFRDNDNPSLPWAETAIFGTDQGIVDAVSLIQSNFSTQFAQTGVQGPGNLAVVARVGSTLLYFYRDDVAPFAWHGPTMTIATGVTGNPSFVQATPGTYGTMGNYELVTPLATGGMAHFFRNNDDPTLPWTQTVTFGTTLGLVNGVSLIQSNFSTAGNGPGNLAVVSVANNQADYFYRDDK